jgi:hypothetical protein
MFMGRGEMKMEWPISKVQSARLEHRERRHVNLLIISLAIVYIYG